MPLRWVVLLASFVAWPVRVEAQTRPLLTEEAATARAGTVVLEIGGDAMRAAPNFETGRARTRADGPLLRLVYSPADAVEVDLEWVGAVIAFGDPDFGDVWDYGDVSLRTKLRFIEESPGRPALSARFGVTLPETSFGRGLGPNTLRMSAQILVSKSVAGFHLHGNAGLAVHDEVYRPHEQRDFLAYGIAAVRRVGPRVSVMAELAGLAGDGMPGADAHAEARLGLRYGNGQARWDGALRRGLGEADGTWGVSVGLTLRPR